MTSALRSSVSYLAFHSAFIVPALALVLVSAQFRRRLPGVGRAVAAVCGIAFLYTIAWDNYLVAEGVWSYPEERVLMRIGYVPLEEYLFFLLQPLLGGWAYAAVAGRDLRAQPGWRFPGVFVFGLFAITGALMITLGGRWTYLGLILAWATPVLAVMWGLGHAWIRGAGNAIASVVLLATCYLWVADRYAIAVGIWDITPSTSLPFVPFGLPIEEAVFFLLTTVLSVWGVVLLSARLAGTAPHA